MGRLLSTKPNTLTIHDNISNSQIVFQYRMPTTEERMNYSNSIIQRTRKGVTTRHSEIRQKYGAKILLGFRDGDFEYEDDDGNVLPLTMENPEWKKLICEMAPDLVELLAAHVFDAPAEITENETEKNS
jgi:hypothetical protein